MSLINDVLRDLDARGAPLPRPAQPLPAPSATPMPRRSRSATRLLPAILLIAAVLLSLWWLWQAAPSRDIAIETPPLPQAMPSPTTASTEAIAVTPETHDAAASTAAVTDIDIAEPEHTQAADSSRALDRGASLTPAAPSPATPAPIPSVPAAPVASPPAPTASAKVAESSNDPARQLRDAAAALAAGRQQEAELQLRELLARHPDATRARLALAALYQQQGRDEAAMAIWHAGLERDPGDLALAEPLARSLIAAQRPGEAATVLARALPPLPQQPDLHALAAFAWQQARSHAAAADRYGALVALDPSQGRWWLGLAIAEEARGDRKAALIAFRRAQTAAGLESAVLRYVEQRILALAADPP